MGIIGYLNHTIIRGNMERVLANISHELNAAAALHNSRAGRQILGYIQRLGRDALILVIHDTTLFPKLGKGVA